MVLVIGYNPGYSMSSPKEAIMVLVD